MSEKHNKKANKLYGLRDDIFRKPAMDKSDIAKEVELLASRVENNQDLRQVYFSRLVDGVCVF